MPQDAVVQVCWRMKPAMEAGKSCASPIASCYSQEPAARTSPLPVHEECAACDAHPHIIKKQT